MKSAAVILIGNELLSGKIEDENGLYAIRRLRGLGVALKRLVVVPDIEANIAEEVSRCSQCFDFVITSGGVGPTHDDITLESIAGAFAVKSVEHPVLADQIKRHFSNRLTSDHLRMAQVPEGTVLIEGPHISWPVIKFKNIYIFPGIPQLFRLKFETIAHLLKDGEFYLRSLDLNADEGTIAADLRALEEQFDVSVGSYPRFGQADFKVRVTIESKRAGAVNRATDDLKARLPSECIVRIAPPATESDKHDTDQ